jgi:peptidoglycan-N-acetylglucosamine deacetylase
VAVLFNASRARLAGALRRSHWWPTHPARRLKDLAPGLAGARTVALTFDDGPDPKATPAILEILARWEVKATFFVCGASALRCRALVVDILAAGHTIGGHTWNHLSLPELDPEQWPEQIQRCQDLLSELSGSTVRYFRPPWGRVNRRLLRWLADLDLVPVLWSGHGYDWTERAPAVIAANVATALEPGAIILLHDGCGELLSPQGLPRGLHGDPRITVEALPIVLEATRTSGYNLAPLPHAMPGLGRRKYRQSRFVPG